MTEDDWSAAQGYAREILICARRLADAVFLEEFEEAKAAEIGLVDAALDLVSLDMPPELR